MLMSHQVRSRSGNSRDNNQVLNHYGHSSGAIRGIIQQSANKGNGSIDRGLSPERYEDHSKLAYDLADKNKVIETKNHEIVRLRLELDELKGS